MPAHAQHGLLVRIITRGPGESFHRDFTTFLDMTGQNSGMQYIATVISMLSDSSQTWANQSAELFLLALANIRFAFAEPECSPHGCLPHHLPHVP